MLFVVVFVAVAVAAAVVAVIDVGAVAVAVAVAAEKRKRRETKKQNKNKTTTTSNAHVANHAFYSVKLKQSLFSYTPAIKNACRLIKRTSWGKQFRSKDLRPFYATHPLFH